MSDTIVDMPKVTQMLDAGWKVEIERGAGGYVARAHHDNHTIWLRARDRLHQQMLGDGQTQEFADDIMDIDFDEAGVIDTDDFTPEQALTRLAYKVHGEVI